MIKIRSYKVTKEINGVKYTAQFAGSGMGLRAKDASNDENGNVLTEKLATFILDNVIVEPQGLDVDSFESLDELNEDMREVINQKTLSTPMKWVERDFQAHIINYGNNPVDEWCLGNACCFIDGHENYSCKKSQANKRIDGAVVFIILYATLMRFNSEYQRFIK